MPSHKRPPARPESSHSEEYNLRRAAQEAGFATFHTPPDKKFGRKGWKVRSTRDPSILTEFSQGDGTMAHMGRSGMLNLDLDRHSHGIDGVANFKSLVRENVLKLPKTLVHDTPSDGRHVFFIQNPDCPISTSHSRLAPGVDLLADTSLSMIPPTPGYRVRIQHTIAVIPLETARFIAARTTTGTQRLSSGGVGSEAKHSFAGIMTTLANAQPGERNSTLYWALQRVAEMPAKQHHRLIKQLSREANYIGLGDWEIGQTVDSVFGARRG